MRATEVVAGRLYRVNGMILVEAKYGHDAIFKVLRAMVAQKRRAA